MDAPVSVYGSPLVSAIITAKWHEGVKWHLLNQGIWFLLYFGLFMAFQVGGLLAEQLVVAGRVLNRVACCQLYSQQQTASCPLAFGRQASLRVPAAGHLWQQDARFHCAGCGGLPGLQWPKPAAPWPDAKIVYLTHQRHARS